MWRNKKYRRRWSALFCYALLAGFLQGQNSPGVSNVAQKRIASFLRDPLPARTSAQEPPAFYSPDSLYQYIDGGADIFLLYDFQLLLHQNLKNAQAELNVDIYDMGKPEDAFGIYAAERSTRYAFVPIGIEGYRSKGILNFLQDRYYVKLAGSGAGADALLVPLARLLSQRIGGVRTFPALLRELPQAHRVQHSEQYMRKDPMGHAFLAPAYMIGYSWTSKESKLLISVAGSVAEARARLEQLAKHFRESGECVSAPELGEGGIRARNSYEGRLIARTQGRYVVILLEPPPDGVAIVKSVAQNLP